jgi:hypothetical protein
MRWPHGAILAVLLAAPLALAAPPVDVPAEVKGEPGAFVAIRAKTDGKVVRFVALDAGLNVFPAELLADKRATVVSATRPGRYRLLAYSSVKDDPTDPAVVVVVIGMPTPDPKPDPEPTPDPKPVPVTSFRVFLVYESGDTLTAAQNAVLYGRAVEDWLTATCTGGRDGWRRRDKDLHTSELDTPPLKTLWANARPKVTQTPCAVVEVNGAVTVIPLPGPTPADAIAALKKYAEGK